MTRTFPLAPIVLQYGVLPIYGGPALEFAIINNPHKEKASRTSCCADVHGLSSCVFFMEGEAEITIFYE